ncbi:MAG: phosphoglycerate kinase [Candidatus Curtissbacteria bacterium]
MKLLSDIDVSGKRVFLRGDLDVDVVNPADSVRLDNLKSTTDYLFEHGAQRILLAGHIGRPQGPDPEFSTRNLLEPLKQIFGQEVFFQNNFEEENGGKIVLFENLRFWPEEEANDTDFAHTLVRLADVYINEAFAVCHRAHASMVGVPALLPHAAGLHLQKEVEELSKLLEAPEKPFVAIVGGAKIETKIPVIQNLSKIADTVLVGGYLPMEIKKQGLKFPANVVVANLTGDTKDMDGSSINKFVDAIGGAKTVVWNGNLGLTEEGFAGGTKSIAEAISQSGVYSVVGGGDTTAFLIRNGLIGRFSFISSGGGAMLEYLAGKKLPAIEALA